MCVWLLEWSWTLNNILLCKDGIGLLLIRIRCHGRCLLIRCLIRFYLSLSFWYIISFSFLFFGKPRKWLPFPNRWTCCIMNFPAFQMVLDPFAGNHKIWKSSWITSYQFFQVVSMKGTHKHVNKFLLKKRGLDPSNQLSPSLGVLFKQLISFLHQALELGSIWSHIHIILIIFKKCITQFLPGSNRCIL